MKRLGVDKLLRLVFPVDQEIAEANGVASDKTVAGWREVRRRLDEHWKLTHKRVESEEPRK